MKNVRIIAVFTVLFFLFSPMTYAQGGNGSGGSNGGSPQNGNGPTPTLYGEQEQEKEQEQKQSDEPGQTDTMEQEREQERETNKMQSASSTKEIQSMIQERHENQERLEEGLGEEVREAVRSQNRSMIATEALTMAGVVYGNRSEEMQSLVEEFKTSQERAHQAEEKLSEQGAINRFFFGSDKEATQNIVAEAEQNKNRIQEMNQVIEDCDCEAPLQTTLQEQLQLMEAEQNRLEAVAKTKGSKRGLFGFLFGWLSD